MQGLELAHRYYDEVLGPLLLTRWPGLPHAAGRLGSGSEVLGLDDATSRDHDWGLRLTLLVDDDFVQPVDDHLEAELPETFIGWPTRFPTTWEPTVRHRVEVTTSARFTFSHLGVDVRSVMTPLDWLSFTGQSVLEVTGGEVFRDDQGTITDIRHQLGWYPDDVWLLVLAADWARVAQELPFVGRTAARGDDAGSRILTARIARSAMHLGFLLERRWPPYPKWLGTQFATLPRAGVTMAPLRSALSADTWHEREESLQRALTQLHDLQRAVGLPTGPEPVEAFFDRPFTAIKASVSEILHSSISDPVLRWHPVGTGSIEQWVDNVDVLADPVRRVAAARAFHLMLPADLSTPIADVHTARQPTSS